MNLDTHTLTTIIVTAVVTAIARSLVSAIESWLKNSAMLATVRNKLTAWANKYTLSIFIDALAISIVTGVAFQKFDAAGPATKSDLLTLFILCFALTLSSVLLAYDVMRYAIHKSIRSNP